MTKRTLIDRTFHFTEISLLSVTLVITYRLFGAGVVGLLVEVEDLHEFGEASSRVESYLKGRLE